MTLALQPYIDFVLEIDALKGVERATRPLGLARQENSAEHSWQIALLAATLAPAVDPALDLGRVVGMLLVHDLGEVDTGDTIVYATMTGQSGPYVESEMGFDVDGMKIKCRHDFAAEAADFRGLYKNAGA